MKRFPQLFYAFFFPFLIIGCKNDSQDIIVYDVKPFHKKVDEIEPVKDPKSIKTYHTDSTYKYEYRTGESGSYQYHYDVVGENSKGEKVSGEVDMEGKYGVGILNKTTEIEAEWIDKNQIKATDSKGNSYELIVE